MRNKLTGKTLSIIAFIVCITSIISSIVLDLVVFAETIGTFFLGCFGFVFGVFIGVVLLVFSIVFVFGIYLIQDYGFWPINWGITIFQSIMGEVQIQNSQITAFMLGKVILVIIFSIVFILAIVGLSINTKYNKENPNDKKKGVRVFLILSLIFSILGLLFATGVLLISTLIL